MSEVKVKVTVEIIEDDDVRIREFEGDGIVGEVLGDDGFETIVMGSLGSMETCQAFLGLGSKIDEAFRKRDEGFN